MIFGIDKEAYQLMVLKEISESMNVLNLSTFNINEDFLSDFNKIENLYNFIIKKTNDNLVNYNNISISINQNSISTDNDNISFKLLFNNENLKNNGSYEFSNCSLNIFIENNKIKSHFTFAEFSKQDLKHNLDIKYLFRPTEQVGNKLLIKCMKTDSFIQIINLKNTLRSGVVYDSSEVRDLYDEELKIDKTFNEKFFKILTLGEEINKKQHKVLYQELFNIILLNKSVNSELEDFYKLNFDFYISQYDFILNKDFNHKNNKINSI